MRRFFLFSGCIALLTLVSKARGQSIVVLNEKLLEQITANQAARQAAEASLRASMERQQEALEAAGVSAAKVVAVHEVLYRRLYEVSRLLKDSRQAARLGVMGKTLGAQLLILSEHSYRSPQYAALLSRYYRHLLSEGVLLKELLENEVLYEDPAHLLSSYDRDVLLSRLFHRMQSLLNTTQYLISALEFTKNRPYLEQIPFLEDYINLDRMVVESILQKFRSLHP